jgi:hypothetical protein
MKSLVATAEWQAYPQAAPLEDSGEGLKVAADTS